LRAWDWLFLAMAHYEQGEVDKARSCLRRGDRWIAEATRAAAEGRPCWGWTEKIETRLLHEEARALMGQNSLETP